MAGYVHDRWPKQADEWQSRINLDHHNECAVMEFSAHLNPLHDIGGDVAQQEVAGAALARAKISAGQRRRASTLRSCSGDGGPQVQCQGYLQHRKGDSKQERRDEGEFDGCVPLVPGQSHGADTDEIARFSTEVS